MPQRVKSLIIGAGPYGLALASYAKHRKLEFMIIGEPMGFWKANMPNGMLLRSDCDWHIDPLDVHTIHGYLQSQGLKPSEMEPLSRDFFLEYVRWFQKEKKIEVQSVLASSLNYHSDQFETHLQNGEKIVSEHVVVATGLGYFKHIPEELLNLLPAKRFSHCCENASLESLKGKRVLIIGGRQSAFEWAALASENEAAVVHIAYRHDTPEFKLSDWSWVQSRADATVTTPDWFRKLSLEEREQIVRHFFEEGRLKLEPWLGPRIKTDRIKLWPNSRVTKCDELPNGELRVKLDIGEVLTVDHILLATGYKVQLERLPFLSRGNILERLATRNGFPILDEHFQSNVSGLFFSSFLSTQDFGPFFGFVIGAPAAAKVVGSFIANT